LKEYFSFSRIALSFVASWIFSKRELFEFTSRDEHFSWRSQSRWTFEWESYSSQHKKSNQSEIDQLWRSDRQIYNKRTTKQAAFKVAQRLQIDRSTSKTHLRTSFIVKNLRQRWQHLRLFFLSRTFFSVFERKLAHDAIVALGWLFQEGSPRLLSFCRQARLLDTSLARERFEQNNHHSFITVDSWITHAYRFKW
jgi:hypothetical protein